MKNAKKLMRADARAPRKEGLISDAKLLALHRRLLQAVTRRRREENGIERYAAAKIAIWFDLKAADTVIDSADARIRDLIGAARENKPGKSRRVVLTWTSDPGADWKDALEDARAHSLPVVFVRELVDRPKAPARGRKGKLRPGEELPSITVDGHDVVAAYRVAHEAIGRARRHRGPTLIQLTTYQVGNSAFIDPVADMQNYLRGRGLLKTKGNGLSA